MKINPMPYWRIIISMLACMLIFIPACQSPEKFTSEETIYHDHPFLQEYHEAYPVGAASQKVDVRDVDVDDDMTVWIASSEGIWNKPNNSKDWKSIDAGGPAYAVEWDTRGKVMWLGTWQGLYRFQDQQLVKISGIESPVSVIRCSTDACYAAGPEGIWQINANQANRMEYAIAQSVRDLVADEDGAIWVSSDVGLYKLHNGQINHWYKKGALLSAYVNGLDFDAQGQLWITGLGGVNVFKNQVLDKGLGTQQGLPTVYATCVRKSPEGTMWVGTEKGLVRFYEDGRHSLLFSRRWLMHDKVNAISFDSEGNAWLATGAGVSCIKTKSMNLADKADYFYQTLMDRHIRDPWIAGQCRLEVPGDINTCVPEDDDNDGEYTGMYLAMESFRYAATGDPDAREKAGKAFRFLRLLQEVTGTDGFFARTIIPPDWTYMHDRNRVYTDQDHAEAWVREPRYKPVEDRWRLSADGKWRWKGDTSSDEMCGHMFAYFFYYTLAADESEKELIRQHVSNIMDHVIKNDFTLTDIDGKPTRWAVWSPDQLNRNPEWLPDRNLNSMEMLGFLKFAWYITGNEKYQKAYLHLIEEEAYLDNMAGILHQNPAWFIYFDVMLAAYIYPLLILCEDDPDLLSFYTNHMDEWFEIRKDDHNPLINFLYNYTMKEQKELDRSVAFLKDTPLDLVDWTIDHRQREDIQLVRHPVLEDLQVSTIQNPAIRAVVRWDKNPWDAVAGYPNKVREPVFWLLPYWMGRYLEMIGKP